MGGEPLSADLTADAVVNLHRKDLVQNGENQMKYPMLVGVRPKSTVSVLLDLKFYEALIRIIAL